MNRRIRWRWMRRWRHELTLDAFAVLCRAPQPLTTAEIAARLDWDVADADVWRALNDLRNRGLIGRQLEEDVRVFTEGPWTPRRFWYVDWGPDG